MKTTACEYYIKDTIFERIVKVCLKEPFINSNEQDDLATRVLLAASTNAKTRFVSWFDSEIRERNYKLAHRIIYEQNIENALHVYNAEAERGKENLIDCQKLADFLNAPGRRFSAVFSDAAAEQNER